MGQGREALTHHAEFPQSGERFEGVASFKEWRRQYPAAVTLEMRSLRGQGDLWVVEGAISYDGGPWQPAVNILEFRGNKVTRETIYVTELGADGFALFDDGLAVVGVAGDRAECCRGDGE